MFKIDFKCSRFIPQGGGGFLVKDPIVLTEVLKNISSSCLAANDTHLTWLIEFARAQYSEAFAAFDPKVLEKAVVIHIACDTEQIYKRLEERAKSGGANVTKEVIEKFYKEDDAPNICEEMGLPCVEVDNNASINELDDKTNMIVRRLNSIAETIYR